MMKSFNLNLKSRNILKLSKCWKKYFTHMFSLKAQFYVKHTSSLYNKNRLQNNKKQQSKMHEKVRHTPCQLIHHSRSLL